MPHFVLVYEFVPDFMARRMAVREAHLQFLRDAQACGLLQTSGPLGDPPDGALLVFHGPHASVAEAFARNDPYVINGLVTAWRVRPWNVVTGDSSGRRQM